MRITNLLSVLFWLTFSTSSHAGSARIAIDLSPTLTAEADYWPGEAGRPALLLLHGFLQTREFPTVRRLAESLSEEGFTVLAPSLTLGISRRKQALSCEAMHTHSMSSDADEIQAWTRWLASRSGRAPVVVGHSIAGVQLAAVLESAPALPLERVVLLSVTGFEGVPGGRTTALMREKALQSDDPQGMGSYALGFCREYITTPRKLLSYLAWDAARLRSVLLASKVPVAVIYDSGDDRVDLAWMRELQLGGVQVRAVEGADHFFDHSHEFALFDEVVSLVDGGDRG